MQDPSVRSIVLGVCVLWFSAPAGAADLAVNTDAQFHAALRAAKPGDHIRLGPGPFKGGFYHVGLAGAKDRPIRISGPSPKNPAVFATSTTGIMQLVQASYVEVENLHVQRAIGNALAFDDGGKLDFSCHHIAIRHVRIEDVGPQGTANAIKLAGVSDFSITDSSFQKWGEGGGCAIDGVGCKNGLVEHCFFLPGRGSVAVQFKGGSESIVIRQSLFDDPAPRGINVGGSTGMQFFRPKPQGFEARKITIEGNLLIGCDAPIAFPNTDGAEVRFNTIYVPRKWAFRILQETNRDDFTPSRNGRIENNIIVFKSTQWYEGGVNIGPHTAPETFTFSGNVWYCLDNPAKSAPKLPSPEQGAVVGRDPLLRDPANRDFGLMPGSPAKGKGHTALAKSTPEPKPRRTRSR